MLIKSNLRRSMIYDWHQKHRSYSNTSKKFGISQSRVGQLLRKEHEYRVSVANAAKQSKLTEMLNNMPFINEIVMNNALGLSKNDMVSYTITVLDKFIALSSVTINSEKTNAQ